MFAQAGFSVNIACLIREHNHDPGVTNYGGYKA